MKVNEKYYSRFEVARMLSTHPMTIYREIRRGKLAAIKVGGDLRITESSLDAYIKKQKYEGTQSEG